MLSLDFRRVWRHWPAQITFPSAGAALMDAASVRIEYSIAPLSTSPCIKRRRIAL